MAEQPTTKTNHLRILSADDIVFANAKQTVAGWSWRDGALTHRTGQSLRFSPELTREIDDAIANVRPMESAELTGSQVAALPEDQRAGYRFSHTINDAIGIYVKRTMPKGVTVDFGKADLR